MINGPKPIQTRPGPDKDRKSLKSPWIPGEFEIDHQCGVNDNHKNRDTNEFNLNSTDRYGRLRIL